MGKQQKPRTLPLADVKDDFDGREEYVQSCQVCRREHVVRTQADENPEYRTSVFVRCTCGQYVEFVLPVN